MTELFPARTAAAPTVPEGVPELTVPELTVIVPCFNERPNVAPLVAKLEAALRGLFWEVLFVDDDSPDGTAEAARAIAARDGRVRCLRRVGRRGLSSAVIEGALVSSARYVAVMDGDLQHDETVLPAMLGLLRAGGADIVVGSRRVVGGDPAGLSGTWRHRLSEGGTWLANAVIPVRLADPMSGFFMLPRALFESSAPRLSGRGFKILLDLLLAMPRSVRVREIPYRFNERAAGESKLNALVLAQFGGVLADRALHGLLPLRFLSFACVGLIGLLVHLAVLTVAVSGLAFEKAQVVATIVAMIANFELNNRVTYADQRLRGRRFWSGLALFMLVCGLGAIANIGIAQMLYQQQHAWTIAGAAGAMIGLVWNYAVSSTLVWRAR